MPKEGWTLYALTDKEESLSFYHNMYEPIYKKQGYIRDAKFTMRVDYIRYGYGYSSTSTDAREYAHENPKYLYSNGTQTPSYIDYMQPETMSVYCCLAAAVADRPFSFKKESYA